MANKAEEDPNAVFKYEEVEVRKVDIVGGPATGDKFMVIRNDDNAKVPRRAMTKQAIKALSDNDPESPSVPVVARQEAVEAAVEVKPEKEPESVPVPVKNTDRVTPSEVEGETLPVERTEEEPENISEETQMSVVKLTKAVTDLTGLVERMEGTFSNVLGAAAGAEADTEAPTPEEAPKAEGEPEEAPVEVPEPEAAPEPEEVPKAEDTPAPEEAPQEAPVVTEPVADAPAPAPVETPQEAPVAAPVAADPAPAEDITQAVTDLAGVVERMGEAFNKGLESLGTKVEGMATRVNKVERSVLSGGNSDQDETEGPIERGEQPKPGLFSNIINPR